MVTDTLISIPEEPPELLRDALFHVSTVSLEPRLRYRRALAYHARDSDRLLDERQGWPRIALFATFFNPGALANGEVKVPEARLPSSQRLARGGDAALALAIGLGAELSTAPAGWQSLRSAHYPGPEALAKGLRADEELILKQQPEKTLTYVDARWIYAGIANGMTHIACGSPL